MNSRKLRFLVLLFIALLLVISTVKLHSTRGVEQHAALEKFTTHLDECIPAIMKDYDIPGVCTALIQQGKTVWTKAYGYADLETGRRMTTDTHCRVESISKSVTAWGVMKLVEQGVIELDRPVQSYLKNWRLPASEFSGEKVTVRRLLSHSAGLPLGTIGVRYDPEGEIPSLQASLSGDAILQREPGQAFAYSNTGFNLLELLIEEVTGRDFAEYMATEVLVPLGMRHASFTWSRTWEPPVPNGYDLKGKPVPVYVYPDKASGGLFATVEDIAAFVAAGMSDFSRAGLKVLNAESIRKLHTPAVKLPGFYGLAFDSYGFGHFIERLSNGATAVSHGGQGSGWMTHFHFVPQTGDGIVILTNSQRSWPFMAQILSDWAAWNGFSPVGMGRIIVGQKALWLLIGLLLFVVLWQARRLALGLFSGERRFAPLSKEARFLRSGQLGLSILFLAGLLWAVNQDYLFLSSLFPIASGWLGLVIFLSAVVLLLSSLFPLRGEKKPLRSNIPINVESYSEELLNEKQDD